mgnify:CR=1 FL=1
MSDSEDEKIYDFDPKKVVNEIFIEGEDEKEKEEEKIIEPKKEEKFYNFDKSNVHDECYIENLKEEEDKDIGFDLSLLKRNELYVNLIHFDLNVSKGENYNYFNHFKVDVVGGFIAIDNLVLLKKYLDAIKAQHIPFIVISSGSSGKDVIKICKKFSFVKEVIIFCRDYGHNKHYINDYPGYVKKVLTSIKDVYKYLKTFGTDQNQLSKKKLDHFVFTYEEIDMNRQLEQCPVISAYEYDKCYFLIHRAYAHFFGNMKDKKSLPDFDDSSFQKIKEYIENSKLIKTSDQDPLIEKFKSLKGIKNFSPNNLGFLEFNTPTSEMVSTLPRPGDNI